MVGKPYIPGSSLKGKCRALLEIKEGLAFAKHRVRIRGGDTEITLHLCNRPDCPICLVFGRMNVTKLQRVGPPDLCSIDPAAAKCPKNILGGNPAACEFLCIENTTPRRLVVRDAPLDEAATLKTIQAYAQELAAGVDAQEWKRRAWLEEKWENSIDRVTAAANPRHVERVVRGACFALELVFTVFEEADKERFTEVLVAMQLLEDDYLGAAGSRGSGQIKFRELGVCWRNRQAYQSGHLSADPIIRTNAVVDLIKVPWATHFVNA